MSEHTPGKLRTFFRAIGTHGGALLFKVYAGEKSDQDARRLVACWNACEGIPTDVLEKTMISESLWVTLTKERDSLRAVNAELEGALVNLIGVITDAGLFNLSNGVQLGQTVWYVKASDAMDSARAAIASARKQAGATK